MRGWVRTRGRNWGADFNPWTLAAFAESMAFDDDESEAEVGGGGGGRCSDSLCRLAFGLCGSACGSSNTRWGGQCGCVPMAIGAPSHTHGLSFTRKPQPVNNSSPRTFLTEAVVAASGPGGVARAAGGREERRRGAAVQKTVTMVVDVPVLFDDKFPQS